MWQAALEQMQVSLEGMQAFSRTIMTLEGRLHAVTQTLAAMDSMEEMAAVLRKLERALEQQRQKETELEAVLLKSREYYSEYEQRILAYLEDGEAPVQEGGWEYGRLSPAGEWSELIRFGMDEL